MKTLIVFYSLSGHARDYAIALAKEICADRQELRPVKPVGKVMATLRMPDTLKGRSWDIQPIIADLSAYDQLIICAPIWANNVPPYVNRFLEDLPAGKDISLKLISGSGASGGCRARLAKVIAGKGCTLVDADDIKG